MKFIPLLLLLAACAPAAINDCPKPFTYNADEQKQIAAAIRKLPQDSILHTVLLDWSSLRAQLKAK